jgi:hypothetical protein
MLTGAEPAGADARRLHIQVPPAFAIQEQHRRRSVFVSCDWTSIRFVSCDWTRLVQSHELVSCGGPLPVPARPRLTRLRGADHSLQVIHLCDSESTCVTVNPHLYDDNETKGATQVRSKESRVKWKYEDRYDYFLFQSFIISWEKQQRRRPQGWSTVLISAKGQLGEIGPVRWATQVKWKYEARYDYFLFQSFIIS